MFGALFYSTFWLLLNALRVVGLLRWRVEGLEHLPPNGGVVMVSNHVHWLDIVVHGALMPFRQRPRWIAKAELLDTFFGRLVLGPYMIPIRRGERDTAALDLAVAELRKGHRVLIYPEGTRSRTGVLQKGKPGALLVALESGCRMVPVATVGTEGGVKGALFGKILVRIGPAFDPPVPPDAPRTLRGVTRSSAEMMRHIAVLLPAERRGPYAGAPAVEETVEG